MSSEYTWEDLISPRFWTYNLKIIWIKLSSKNFGYDQDDKPDPTKSTFTYTNKLIFRKTETKSNISKCSKELLRINQTN